MADYFQYHGTIDDAALMVFAPDALLHDHGASVKVGGEYVILNRGDRVMVSPRGGYSINDPKAFE